MKHRLTAVILATGGLGLVRAAYSSGKPAFGVGPGNVPAFIERTADVPKAVRDILTSKCFDFGTICASEQAVVVDAAVDAEVRAQFAAQGAYFMSASEAESLAKLVVTPQRALNPKVVGKPATTLAEWAGISVPSGTRCLMAEVAGVGREFPLSIEKLSPILAYYTANGLEEGVRLCDAILHYGGMGHTAAIHSRDRQAVLHYGMLMPAARVVVNTPSTHGAIGYSTALAPSMTLGCGSWGGNVTSDNISPLHLMDIKRVAFETRPVTSESAIPSSVSAGTQPAATLAKPVPTQPTATRGLAIDRAAIAALVDRFLKSRSPAGSSEEPKEPAPANGRVQAAEFVCEDDVRQAVKTGAKIYINAKTIITPAARELGDTRDIFAKA